MQMQPTGSGWVYYIISQGRFTSSYNVATTTDDGLTWQTNQFAFGRSTVAPLYGNTGLDFWRLPNMDSYAVVLANDTNQGQIIRQVAGAATWTTAYSAPGVNPFAIRFFDNTTGFFLARTSATSPVSVYRTVDAGTTWTAQAATLAIANSETVNKVIEVQNGHAWLTTSTGNVWHSADAGQSWTVSATSLTNPELCMHDTQNGLLWTESPAQLMRTTDGGQTWNTLAPAGAVHYSTIAPVKSQPGTYLSGGQYSTAPGLSISTDNGSSWQLIESTERYRELQAASSSKAWALNASSAPMGYVNNYFLRLNRDVISARRRATTAAAPSYPNPTTGRLTVPGGAGCTAQVFDAVGRLQYSGTVSAAAVLDLSACRTGLYRVQFTDPKGGTWEQQVAISR